MKRKITAFLLLSAAALAQGCGTSTETEHKEPPPTAATNLAFTKLTRSSVADYYEASGTVKAKTTTEVSANLMGRIVSFAVKEGDAVAKGQVLIEIDNRDTQAQLRKARAGLKEAEATLSEVDNSITAARAGVRTAEADKQLAEVTFRRYKELYERKSVSGQEYDTAQTKLRTAASELERAKASVEAIVSKKSQVSARIEQAKADIASTEVNVGYARIVAPISGLIVKKFAEPGSMASPGVPLLSIEDTSTYRLEVNVEESRSNLVRLGERVGVRIDALGGGEFWGVVAEILPALDASSRTSTVKVDLPANPDVRSGQYGLARFPKAQREAITVPEAAILVRGQLTGVHVVGADGVARFRIVTVGERAEGSVEILSGLSEGDDVVSAGTERVKDGEKVR